MKKELVVAAVILLSGCTTEQVQLYRAEPVEVVDGDTLTADTGEAIEHIRLRGVDTPEITGPVQPWEYEGIPDSQAARECLRQHGLEAANFTQNFTSTGFQLVTRGKRGRYGRLLATVRKGNRSLNRLLIRKGYARVYDSDYSRAHNLSRIEDRAQREMKGLWSCRIHQLQETKIK